MKLKDAIKCCQGMIRRLERPAFMAQHEGSINDITALDMAISALEKQIPKEPKTIEEVYTIKYYCPTCGMYYGQRGTHSVFLFPTPKHCTECGQAIKWESEK